MPDARDLRRAACAALAMAAVGFAGVEAGGSATRGTPKPVLRTFMAPSGGEHDSGSLMSVGGDPQAPPTMTAGKLEKLARARAAIEASKRSGTLSPVPAPGGRTEVTDEARAAALAAKLQRLRSQAPVPYGPEHEFDRGAR